MTVRHLKNVLLHILIRLRQEQTNSSPAALRSKRTQATPQLTHAQTALGGHTTEHIKERFRHEYQRRSPGAVHRVTAIGLKANRHRTHKKTSRNRDAANPTHLLPPTQIPTLPIIDCTIETPHTRGSSGEIPMTNRHNPEIPPVPAGTQRTPLPYHYAGHTTRESLMNTTRNQNGCESSPQPNAAKDMPDVLLDCATAVKRPVTELADLLADASASDKKVFNTRIGSTPFGVIGNEFAAGVFYHGDPQLMPFLYGSCYAALQISAAIAELDGSDEMVTAKCRQITEACADLIQAYEAYADSIYAAHK